MLKNVCLFVCAFRENACYRARTDAGIDDGFPGLLSAAWVGLLDFSRGDNERWQLVAFDSSVCHWSRLNPAVFAGHSVSHLSRTAIKHRHRRRRLGGPFQMAGPGPRANKSHRFHFSTRSKSEKVCRREIKSEQPFSQLATEILIFPVCSARQLVALPPRPTTFC